MEKSKRRRSYARAYYRLSVLCLAAMVTARLILLMIDVTTIACAAMRSAIGNEQRKQSRRIKTVSLDDPIPGTDGMTWEDIITEDHLVYSA